MTPHDRRIQEQLAELSKTAQQVTLLTLSYNHWLPLKKTPAATLSGLASRPLKACSGGTEDCGRPLPHRTKYEDNIALRSQPSHERQIVKGQRHTAAPTQSVPRVAGNVCHLLCFVGTALREPLP